MLIGFSDLVSLDETHIFIRFGIFGFSLSIIIWLSLRPFTQHHCMLLSLPPLLDRVLVGSTVVVVGTSYSKQAQINSSLAK
jgi:hypothetical protein